MTAELLAALAGGVLSALFSYVPGLSHWFDALDGTYKRLIMLALLALVSVGVVAGSCWGLFDGIPCSKAGVLEFVKVFIAAAVANQAAYSFAPKAEWFALGEAPQDDEA